MNVPDSIEPVHGWKALTLRQTTDGVRLYSPQYSTMWTPKQPTSSRCTLTRPHWTAVPTAAEAAETLRQHQQRLRDYHARQQLGPNIFTTATHIQPPEPPQPHAITPAGGNGPQPAIILPNQHWGIKWQPAHPPGPAEHCTCGIYIANNTDIATGYINPGDPTYALVKVAGWGQVIPHDHGWRVQHAYPQEIHLPHNHPYADALQQTYRCQTITTPAKTTHNYRAPQNNYRTDNTILLILSISLLAGAITPTIINLLT